MARERSVYRCQACGFAASKPGTCPDCARHGQYLALVEERLAPARPARPALATGNRPTPFHEIAAEDGERVRTGIGELDRVLGGGVVHGSLVLIGGDPGIGKSTLILQACHALARAGAPVLYVSGEESAGQVKLRADRLGVAAEHLYFLAETDLTAVEAHQAALKPAVLVVDSIQTAYLPALESAPGSVSQVRECGARLMMLAKSQGVATFLVGHVTKEGALAGPRVLEHLVDTVLYFEGEHHHAYRVLRAIKNRFGSTNEIGVFEMAAGGLAEVRNPSRFFLSERPRGAAGSVIVSSLEGSRPLLLELQALVTPASFGTPRRTVLGTDYNRVCLLLAVLEKRLGFPLQSQDAFVNVAGGGRVTEPAVDLGVLLAAASSYLDRPVAPDLVVMGEVGLTGEVRAVSGLEGRLREAAALGFSAAVVPRNNLAPAGASPPAVPTALEVQGVGSVEEAVQLVLGGSEAARE
ncbi:MAG: DNA repair protein RadA [Candidatus Rokubacteria bacterium]|nr:DNA repair protein RadA [Candidatus Rokubacteria bacterium]